MMKSDGFISFYANHPVVIFGILRKKDEIGIREKNSHFLVFFL